MKISRLAVGAGLLIALVTVVTPSFAQAPPALSDELLRIIAELEGVEVVDDISPEPPRSPLDEGAPAFRLPAEIAALEEMARSSGPVGRRPLQRALTELREAWDVYSDGSGDRSLSHLQETLASLERSLRFLRQAATFTDGRTGARIEESRRHLARVAQRIAHGVFDRAERAGVSPRHLVAARRLLDIGDLQVDNGRYQVAVGLFGKGFKQLDGFITFDVDLFDQIIRDVLDDESVGYAYSITVDGQIYQGGGSNGLARTAADPPVTAQSPDKEIQVASVSKTLTAILTLRLLEENGLTPDAPIVPWLPSDWELGNGVDQLTFCSFLTHSNGFKQNNPTGNTYGALRELIAKDVGATNPAYSNTNFAMQRVLAAGLLGIDPVDFPEFESGVLTASAFILYIQQVYGSIGIQTDCSPSDPIPTRHYNFPDTGDPGFLDPPYPLACGGFGFFISANELAGVLTSLRYTETLVSAESFELMKDGYLGFLDPARYSWGQGAFGVYYNHGGDWDHGAGHVDSCVMMFPITVEVSLVINSSGGDYSTDGTSAHQCRFLRNAFDDAWVAN